MKVRNVLVLAAVVALALTAAACASTETAETTTTTKAARDFEVSTPQGAVSLSLDGKLPPDWPKDFPLPDSAEPAGSGSAAQTDKGVQVAVFTTKESTRDTLDFYSDNDDLKTDNRSFAGAGSNEIGSLDLVEPYTGSVTVVSRDGKGYLVVNLSGGTDAAGGSSTNSSSTTATTTTAPPG
jgi:hypothetical protein